MIPENILQALKTVYDRIHNENILWVLSGSTSLAVQGVDIEVSDDIDIVTDKEGAQRIDKLLSNFRIKKPEYSSTDKYRSYFGVYQIDNVKVEVMGDFQYRMKDGSWSPSANLREVANKELEGMKLPLFSLHQEIKEYENLGILDKVRKIKEVLT